MIKKLNKFFFVHGGNEEVDVLSSFLFYVATGGMLIVALLIKFICMF